MINYVWAHETGEEEPILPSATVDTRLKNFSVLGIEIASVIAIILILLAFFWKNKSEKAKRFLFLGIAIPVVLTTLFLAGSTIYLNLTSVSGGPVHWHADFQVWACGKELDLIDPTGLSNRVGSPVFHEHGDDRIHIEGVITDSEDASLSKFFGFVGGELHDDHFTFPTNEKTYEYRNGDLCPDGKAGTLQLFVWKTDQEEKEFYQTKPEDPESYVISPFGTVPPGDCLILEFGPQKETTDRLCEFYRIFEQKGELKRR